MMGYQSKKSRKYISLGVTTAVLAAAVAPAAMVANADELSFTDINSGDTGYDQVMSLATSGIIHGYTDQTFKPYLNVSREQVAVMLTNALNLKVPDNIKDTLSIYSDVNENSLYAKEIAAVTAANIFKGSGGHFNSNQNITRAQLATVLVNAYKLHGNHDAVNLTDLNSISDSHRDNVKILAQLGISIGKEASDHTRYYDASGDVKRVEFAILLDKTMKYAQNTTYVTLNNPSSVNVLGTTEQSALGNGSWQSIPGQKMEQYIDLSMFGVTDVKVKDIKSISYQTKNSGTKVDFGVEIYTAPTGTDDDSSWYGKRLSSEPMYANHVNAPARQWNTWSTNDGTNQLNFYDSNRTSAGFAGEPTLSDIQSGDIDWSKYDNSNSKDVVDYADQTVKYIKLQNSTVSDWVNFDGYVDNLVITLNDGQTFIFDMEDDSLAPALVKDITATDGTSIADGIFNINDQTANNEKFTVSYDGINYVAGDTLVLTSADGQTFTKTLTVDDLKAGASTIDVSSYFDSLKADTTNVTFTAAVKDSQGNVLTDKLPSYSVAVDLVAPKLQAVANDTGGTITASEPLYYELNGVLTPITSEKLDSTVADDAARIDALFTYNDGTVAASKIIGSVDVNADTNTWVFTTLPTATLKNNDTLTYNDESLFDKNGNQLSSSIIATYNNVTNSWAINIQK